MTAQILMVFEIWCFFWFFILFSKNLERKKLTELDFRFSQPPYIRALGTLKSCKSSVKVWLLKSFWFSRHGVFYDFFFFKKLRYKKLIELKFLNPSVGCFRGNFEGYKSGVQLWLLKSLWFSRYGFFHDFFFFFPKN